MARAVLSRVMLGGVVTAAVVGLSSCEQSSAPAATGRAKAPAVAQTTAPVPAAARAPVGKGVLRSLGDQIPVAADEATWLTYIRAKTCRDTLKKLGGMEGTEVPARLYERGWVPYDTLIESGKVYFASPGTTVTVLDSLPGGLERVRMEQGPSLGREGVMRSENLIKPEEVGIVCETASNDVKFALDKDAHDIFREEYYYTPSDGTSEDRKANKALLAAGRVGFLGSGTMVAFLKTDHSLYRVRVLEGEYKKRECLVRSEVFVKTAGALAPADGTPAK